MKRQPSGTNTRQEQSVERLKSCIADLKKLASNKVQKKVNNYMPNNGDQNTTTFGESQPLSEHQQYGAYQSRHRMEKNNQQLNQAYAGQDKQKNTHHTKIANALKKYINEIEGTATSQISGKMDYGYKESFNNGSNRGQSDRRESHRGRSASNKKKKSTNPNATRGHSAHHQREDSYSRKDSTYANGSASKKKKQLENSMKSNKNNTTYGSSVGNYQDGYSTKQQPRKAKSQERFNSQLREEKMSPSNNIVQRQTQNNSMKQSRPQSSSTYMQKNSDRNENSYPDSYSQITKNSQKQNQDRKPFAFYNHLFNQTDNIPSSQVQQQPYVSTSYKKSATQGVLLKQEEYKPENSSQAIDIRIKNNKLGETDYQVMSPPYVQSSNGQNSRKDNGYNNEIYSKESSTYKKYDNNSSQSYLVQQQQKLESSNQRSSSQTQGRYSNEMGYRSTSKENLNSSYQNILAQQQQQNYRPSQKTSERGSQHDNIQGSYSKKAVQNFQKDQRDGIRSLQEAANLTQSTDFSENRIQSLEQKRILSLQSNNQQLPSSIYSIQQQTNQYGPINQNTSSSLQNQVLTYGYGQSTVGGGIGNMMRTANATREDFNIEDLHCQVVFKLQRTKKVLREIELLPNEREQEFLLEDTSEFGSGRLVNRYSSNNNKGNHGGRQGNGGYLPNTVLLCPEEEIICGDGCSKPAILFGKKY